MKRSITNGHALPPRGPTLHGAVLTTTDVARILHISSRTAKKWADDGALPCWFVGQDRRFLRSDIIAYARRQGISVAAEEVQDERMQVVFCGVSEELVSGVDVGGANVCEVRTLFSLGLVIDRMAARHAIVLDADTLGRTETQATVVTLRAALPECRVVVLGTFDDVRGWLPWSGEGATDVVRKPVTAGVLAGVIRRLTVHEQHLAAGGPQI